MQTERYTVYVIKSESCGMIYIGQTAKITRRLREHNDPHNRLSLFTKRYTGPWHLVYSEEYPTRRHAVRRERWLKSSSGRRFLRNLGIEGGC